MIKLDGYNFIERISGNENNHDWLAQKSGSDEILFIKILTKNAVDAESYNKVIHNANSSKDLHHTNLINLKEIIEKENLTYFISEGIDATTIEETVTETGSLQEKTALIVSLSIAGMLETAYRKKKLCHGNISPSNIIIDKDGAVKLVGLGLPFDKTENSFFTPPEQTTGKSPDKQQSDMYSLGATIYYMLTAKKNFNNNENDNENITATISDKTIDLITKLTHTHPEERYKTWKEALTDIEKAISILTNTTSFHPSTRTNEKAQSPDATLKTVPLWFRSLAWLLLLIFLGWFTYKQLTNKITDKNHTINKQSSLPINDHLQNNTPVASNSGDILNNIKKNIVSEILNNNINMAKETIKLATTPETKKETDKLLDLINSISNPDIYIAKIFSDNIGKELFVMFDKTKRKIIPTATTNANVSAKLILNNNSTPVTFNTKELTTQEKLRLLSSRKDETTSIIKLLLNVKDGNIYKARLLAKSCGPLSQEFDKQLRTKE